MKTTLTPLLYHTHLGPLVLPTADLGSLPPQKRGGNLLFRTFQKGGKAKLPPIYFGDDRKLSLVEGSSDDATVIAHDGKAVQTFSAQAAA